jgi:predicted permease
MEVVCVALPGYIVARQGMFDADKQKFVANLNVALFTPCLSMFCTTIEQALETNEK